MNPLPSILATITGHPRTNLGIDPRWSKLWTQNLFRAWELVFGRRCGPNGAGDVVRIESMAAVIDGVVVRQFYTAKAWTAYAEQCLRDYFTVPKFGFSLVAAPQPVFAGLGTPFNPFGYTLAVTFDSTAGVQEIRSNTLVQTLAFNPTASGETLVVMIDKNQNDDLVSVTFNLATMTFLDKFTNVQASHFAYSNILQNVSSGSQNIISTASGVTNNDIIAIAYSGCDTTTQPNAHTETNGSGGTIVGAITTTVTNTVIVSWTDTNGSAQTQVTGTLRFTQSATFQDTLAEIAAASSGANSSASVTGSSPWAILSVAVQPPQAVGPAGVKTWNGITQSSAVKTYQGVALASVKSVNGIT